MSISVITACYQSVATLPDTLSSVRSQQAITPEYILIDGGSTDGTVDLIRAEHASPGTPVSCWQSEPDQGIYDALNKGIARATGEVLGFLHADDVLAHLRVLQRVAACFEDPSVMACYGDLDYVWRDDPARVVRPGVRARSTPSGCAGAGCRRIPRSMCVGPGMRNMAALIPVIGSRRITI